MPEVRLGMPGTPSRTYANSGVIASGAEPDVGDVRPADVRRDDDCRRPRVVYPGAGVIRLLLGDHRYGPRVLHGELIRLAPERPGLRLRGGRLGLLYQAVHLRVVDTPVVDRVDHAVRLEEGRNDRPAVVAVPVGEPAGAGANIPLAGLVVDRRVTQVGEVAGPGLGLACQVDPARLQARLRSLEYVRFEAVIYVQGGERDAVRVAGRGQHLLALGDVPVAVVVRVQVGVDVADVAGGDHRVDDLRSGGPAEGLLHPYLADAVLNGLPHRQLAHGAVGVRAAQVEHEIGDGVAPWPGVEPRVVACHELGDGGRVDRGGPLAAEQIVGAGLQVGQLGLQGRDAERLRDLADVLVPGCVGGLLPGGVPAHGDRLARHVVGDLVRAVRDRVLAHLRAVRHVRVILHRPRRAERHRQHVDEVRRGLDQVKHDRGRVRRGDARDVVRVLEVGDVGRGWRVGLLGEE